MDASASPATSPAAKNAASDPIASASFASASNPKSPHPRLVIGLRMDVAKAYDYFRPTALRIPYFITEAARLTGHMGRVNLLPMGIWIFAWVKTVFCSTTTDRSRWPIRLSCRFGRAIWFLFALAWRLDTSAKSK